MWNYDFGGQANIVELYISYLRKKIDAGRAPMIHTMRGAGYVLKPATLSRGLESWSLRRRLIVEQIVLLAMVCVVIVLVTELALRAFLVGQLDDRAGRR